MLPLWRFRTGRVKRTAVDSRVNIDGKIALITGASEGIGAACAQALTAKGAKLSLVARDETKLRSVGGAQAVITAGDLMDEEVRRAAVENTLAAHGRIDILINNAGRGLYGPSWRAPLPQVREMFELNVFALLAMTQLVVPHMRQQRSGMVVNIGSIAGKVTLPWFTTYSATKYAVAALTDGLRMELQQDGIHAMLVCPGYVQTAFQDHVIAGRPPATIRRAKQFCETANQCAASIVKGIERDARTIVTPRAGWLFVLAERLFPGLVDARMARINNSLEREA